MLEEREVKLILDYDEQLYVPSWSCSPGRTHDGRAQLPLSSHQRKIKTRDSQKIKEEVLFILVFFLKERGSSRAGFGKIAQITVENKDEKEGSEH